MLYEDSTEMVDIQQALKQAAQEATVQLSSPGIDAFWEDTAKSAGRVFYIEEGPRPTPKLSVL